MAGESVCTIRDSIVDRIGENRFNTWFGETADFQLSERGLSVIVPNAFVGDWIANNYITDLKAATRDVIGDSAIVDVRVLNMGDNKKTNLPTPKVSTPRLPRSRSTMRTNAPSNAMTPQRESRLRGDLESFVVGTSNQLAYSAAQSVVESPRDAFKPLFIHGGCGLGKTHLLQGICNGVRLAHPALRWCYISGEEFTNEFIYAVKSGKIDAFRARFRKVDLLVIDDIHFIANKKATQEEFLHTFNAIDGDGRMVVLSSDRHPRSIGSLSEPLTNRLISGMVVEVESPDYVVRREILRRRVRNMSCTVPDDVLDFIAKNITRNVRELEGAVFKLAALASLMKEEITINLVRSVLQDYLVTDQGPLQPMDIETMVGEFFGVTREAIHSKSRDRTISLARAVAMFQLRKRTNMSFPEIARAMGKKNHTTAVMAIRRIENTLAANETVKWKTPQGTSERLLSEVLADINEIIERQGH